MFSPKIGSNWKLVAAGFSINLILGGMNKANGLIFLGLMEQKGYNRQQASLPFSVRGSAGIFAAPLAGLLHSRFSIRSIALAGILLAAFSTSVCYFSTDIYYLVFFIGFLRGVGMSFAMNFNSALINNSFERHKATAMGINNMGMPGGAFVYPFLIDYFLSEYGLQGTFLLQGGMFLHACYGVIYMHEPELPETEEQAKPKTQQAVPLLSDQDPTVHEPSDGSIAVFSSKAEEPDIVVQNETIVKQPAISESPGRNLSRRYNRSKTNGDKFTRPKRKCCDGRAFQRIFTNIGFYLSLTSQIASLFMMGTFNVVIVDYMTDRGFEMEKILFMLKALAAGQIVGRIGLGWVTDQNYIGRRPYLIFALLASSTLLILITSTFNYGLLLFYAVILGTCHGSFMPVSMVTFSDYIGKEDMYLAVSFARSIKGVASLLQAFLIGFFRDRQGTYDNFFKFVAIFAFIAAFGWFMEMTVLKTLEKKEKQRLATKVLNTEWS